MQEHGQVGQSAGIPLEACPVDGVKPQSCLYRPLEKAFGKCYSANHAQRFSQGMLLGMDINHTHECANSLLYLNVLSGPDLFIEMALQNLLKHLRKYISLTLVTDIFLYR